MTRQGPEDPWGLARLFCDDEIVLTTDTAIERHSPSLPVVEHHIIPDLPTNALPAPALTELMIRVPAASLLPLQKLEPFCSSISTTLNPSPQSLSPNALPPQHTTTKLPTYNP